MAPIFLIRILRIFVTYCNHYSEKLDKTVESLLYYKYTKRKNNMNNKREMNLKLITDIEIDGIQSWDAPDFCDAFISFAVWSDTGLELNEQELDELNEHDDFVYEKVLSSIY